MIDIRLIRENPGIVKDNIKKRFKDEKLILVDKIRKKDIDWRNLKSKVDRLRHQRNTISEEIARAKKENKNVSQLLKKAKKIPAMIEQIEKKSDKLERERNELLLKIPNMIHPKVPIGKDSLKNTLAASAGCFTISA